MSSGTAFASSAAPAAQEMVDLAFDLGKSALMKLACNAALPIWCCTIAHILQIFFDVQELDCCPTI